MKVSELTGAALDWAVAKAYGKIDRTGEVSRIGRQLWCWEDGEHMRYFPSGSWAQGGPIIEREGIDTLVVPCTLKLVPKRWAAEFIAKPADNYHRMEGPTPLIAAMRCFVASKLGDEVEIPQELTQ